jgi:hypothetical protein
MSALAAALCAWLAAAGVAARQAPRTELNFIPFIGGDTDVGVGVGGAGDLSSWPAGGNPYRWRLEFAGMITFKSQQGGGLQIPFQDYYLILAFPHLTPSGRLRLELRPSFTDETTQRYYGIGNASPRPPPDVTRADWQYGRTHAHAAAALRWPILGERLFLRPMIDLSYSAVQVHTGSLLARQRQEGSATVRDLLDGPLAFASIGFETRVEYDARDSELVTGSGSFHSLRVRYVPPLLGGFYHFAQMNLTLRQYRSVGPVTFAGRLMGDMLVGNPPFYELTRIDESSVMGGGKGLRGVPGQRYYGKIKLFGNFEVRTELLKVTVRGKPFVLSPAVFADGGRVWADFQSHPELDGTGLGLKYGFGGGIRLQQGTTFVVRAEVAWSPDAEPIGAYFNAGQLF